MTESETQMLMLPLQTKNCIVTGKPATVFSGHVLAKTFDVVGRLVTISVIAGFVDSETHRGLTSHKGCFGEWKPEYGIEFDEWGIFETEEL